MRESLCQSNLSSICFSLLGLVSIIVVPAFGQCELNLVVPVYDGQTWVSGCDVQVNGVVVPESGCPEVVRIHWDWGDDSENDSWFPAGHTYADNGTYLVTVTPYDSAGDSTSASLDLEITDCQPPLHDPVAYYAFNGSAEDSSGNGRDAEFFSGQFDQGQCDQAAVFAGPDEYAQIPVQSLGDWTVAAWFRETRDTGPWQRVWDFGSPNGYGGAFFLSTNHGRVGGEIGVGMHQVEGSVVFDLGSGTVPDVGSWYHVAVTYDKAGGGLDIYVNGQLSGSHGYNTESFDDFGEQSWYLGRSNWVDPHFEGLIDEVRIYNRALEVTEIEELATSCPQVTPEEKLAAIIGDVILLNLEQGIANSLDAKLSSALDALEDLNGNNDVAAIGKLQACINSVEAQRGNKLPVEIADSLIAAVQAVLDQLSGN